MNKIYVKKLNSNAVLPKYGTDFAAGADLFALLDTETLTIKPQETHFIKTGISLAIPEGYAGFIRMKTVLFRTAKELLKLLLKKPSSLNF